MEAHDLSGKTPLINAIFCPSGDFIPTWSLMVDRGQALIKAGAKVDGTDDYGHSSLMYAAQEGEKSLIAMLLSNYAKIDLQDRNGATAIDFAAIAQSRAGIDFLVESGAPLLLAVESGQYDLANAPASRSKSHSSPWRAVDQPVRNQSLRSGYKPRFAGDASALREIWSAAVGPMGPSTGKR